MHRPVIDILPGVAWNTFLALIPVGLAYLINGIYHTKSYAILKKVSIAFLGLIWFIFLPNTCYLLTEWRHFLVEVGSSNLHMRWQNNSISALSLMIRTLFYLCYSGVGILTFAAAIRPVSRIIGNYIKLWIIGIPFFILMSLGVYLGLILRFNSWDILSRPHEIWWTIARIFYKPELAGLIILFAGFLWISYTAMDIWLDGFMCRMRKTCLKY